MEFFVYIYATFQDTAVLDVVEMCSLPLLSRQQNRQNVACSAGKILLYATVSQPNLAVTLRNLPASRSGSSIFKNTRITTQ
jgi:hypothetical protein